MSAPVPRARSGKDRWDAKLYAKRSSFVRRFGDSLVDTLKLTPGERVIDVGCGPGEVTMGLKRLGCEVVAVDSSAAMVEAAKEKGLDARVVDGHDLDFENEFDAVFSNSALHWMSRDPRRVVKNIHRCLKEGGRFAAEMAGKGTIKSLMTAITSVLEARGVPIDDVNPWYFPSQEEYAELLESEGLRVQQAATFSRETPTVTGPIGWLEMFSGEIFKRIEESEKPKVYEEVQAAMEPIKRNEDGVFVVDYVYVRFLAVKD